MAIVPTSPDWSLVCINNGGNNTTRRTHKPKIPHFLSSPFSPTFRSLNLIIPNSSSSPSSSSTSTSTLMEDQIQLNPKLQDLNFITSDCYERAKQNPEFRPEKSQLKKLARYSIRSRNWGSISSLAQDFREFHVFPDTPTCCGLITACIKARKFLIVNKLLEAFETDREIAVFAFDSAMKGYNKIHMYSSTVVVYQRMKIARIVLDPGSFCRIMEAYMKIGDSNKVLTLFQEFRSTKLNVAAPIHTQVYKILCESLGRSGRAVEALEYFEEMKKNGVPESHSIYSSIICSLAGVRRVKEAEELFNEAESKKMVKDPAVFLKLTLMYIAEGSMDKTLDIVSSMKRAGIRVSDCIFCAIVNGFSKKRGLKAAEKVYKDLISKGCEPGQVTFASIINIYCRLGLYSDAEENFTVMMSKKGFDKCVVAYSSMVAMYGKTGRLRDAMRLVARMKERGCEPNVWIYNSLLDMHGRVLNLRQVEKLWKEMKRRKVVADKVSYTSVISAYSKAREFENCVEYYKEYRMNGGVIDRAMAGIMVGVFSKMSRVDDLVKLLQDMKGEGTGLDGRLYSSALNALRDAGMQLQAKWLQEIFVDV